MSPVPSRYSLVQLFISVSDKTTSGSKSSLFFAFHTYYALLFFTPETGSSKPEISAKLTLIMPPGNAEFE